MKVNLPQLGFCVVLLGCFWGVFCLPEPHVGVNSEKNRVDFDFRKNSEKFPAEVPYSSLWKFEGNEETIRTIHAKVMLSYMNSSMDPCVDFYEYACGNWEQLNPIPRDKSETSVFTMLNNNIQNELREVLSEPVQSGGAIQELGAEDKARLYFNACIDKDTVNRRGVDPLLYLIDELGGWPVLDENWSEEDFDWMKLAIKTSQIGLPSILLADVEMDLKNSTRYSIYLEEAKLGLNNREDYMNAENFEHLVAYRNLIVTVLRLLDVDPEKAEDTAKDIVDFEIQIANITTDMQVRVDLSQIYNPTTIKGLTEAYPHIDWLAYFSGFLDTSLEPSQPIVLLSANYYGNLTKILKAVDQRTLANYMVWFTVFPFLDDLDENFRAALQTFKEAMSGQKEPLARWKECIAIVNSQMGMATGAMFVRRYFDEDSRRETIRLLSDVKDAFRQSLTELSWIDEKTKGLARNKVNQTKLSVGYPDFILDPVQLNNFYSELEVVSGKRFENSINLVRYTKRVRRKRYKNTVDKNSWPAPPAVVNAFFEQTNNRIIIPVGILQPPVFHKHFPRALNYGAMGVFVGHELTHGFDDVGREFDAAGNMIKWWSPESVQEFNEREECFIKQYSKFAFYGKQLHGSTTKGENIADNGGIRQAFRVYRNWQNVNKKAKNDPSEAMPGLNMTNDQLFFLSFAQSWCNAIRPEAAETRIQTNYHCPGKFRVNGALQNFEEFSEAFQCPVGEVMNPRQKCRMW